VKFARAGVIAATIAAAMAAAAACGQFPARAQAAPVAKKRAAPEPVDPVVIGGLRFEAPADGKAKGLGQNGGIVVAHDAASGAELWTVKVYPFAYAANLEADKQDVFITDMKPSPDARSLLVTDERGRRWRVDLATHAAAPDAP
jgi:hypothetical protein